MSKKNPDAEDKIINGPGKWIAATLVGLGTGAAKFASDVRHEFFINIKQYPEFKAKLNEHGERLGALKDQRMGIKRTPQPDSGGKPQPDIIEHITPISTEEFISKYAKTKNAFYREADELAETLGIKSKGLAGYVEGSIQRYRTLSMNTKVPIVFSAAATTVIGFAGTVMLANSISSRNHLKHVENELNKKEADASRV